MENYSITWRTDSSADYKFFHKFNSIVTPPQKGKDTYRYPFADVWIHNYNEEYRIWTFRNHWRKIHPGIGFNASQKWPEGTKLTDFGGFDMRVSIQNNEHLERLFGRNWYDVGATPNYDHLKDVRLDVSYFEMTPRLYAPALSFSRK